ncbi:MAG: ATP-binding protein [Chloroflexota bacterium]
MDQLLHNEQWIRTQLTQTQPQKERIDLLINLAYLIRFSNEEETGYLLEQAKKLTSTGQFEDSPYQLGLTKIKIIQASNEFKKAQYESSIQLANETILELEDSDETMWLSRAYTALGSCFGQLGDQTQSIESLSKGLSIARKGGHKREIANVLNVLATFEDDRVGMYKEAIELAKEIGNQEIYSIASANLGRAYFEDKEFKKAEESLNLAEEIALDISYWSLVGYIYSSQGEVYEAMGDLDRAIEKIEKGIQLAQENEDIFILCSNLEVMARLQRGRGNLTAAIEHIDHALQISAEINEQILPQELFKLKADCLAEQGNHEEALKYAWRYTELRNEQFNEEKAKQRQSLIVSHQAETHKLQAKLEKEKNIELEQKVKERTVALQSALEQAQAANVARDKFLATMSHELRTPINAIIGYSEIIDEVLEDIPESEEVEELHHATDSVLSAARNLLGLVTDVLEISHLESGRVAVNIQPVSLESFINELCNFVKPLMLENENQLIVENEGCQETIQTDPQKLQQILSNILNNAAKFTKKGTVTFKASCQYDGQLLFEIVDTGIGISPENLEVIFEPFMQVEDAYNRNFEGIGLGLAICKQLSNAIGGSLTVDSKLDRGTAFRLSIPLKPQPFQI